MPKSATIRSTSKLGVALGVTGRAARTRGQLLAAARLLFVTRGYHATRPQDITQQAGLGHGTFYVHFPDKLACFIAFTEETSAELGCAVQRALDGVTGFEAMLTAALDAIRHYARAHPHVIPTILHDPRMLDRGRDPIDVMADRWAEFWAGILAVGQASGAVRQDLDAGLAGSAIVGIIRQTAEYGMRHGRNDDEMLREIRDMILHAVGSSKSKPTLLTVKHQRVTP